MPYSIPAKAAEKAADAANGATPCGSFTHSFGGWCDAEARRWKNPDGSEGGIVAVSASVHDSVYLPASVEVWPNAKIVEGIASIGPRASIEKEDWLFVAGPQGSRHAWATAVWSAKHGLRWWVGCQHGLTTDQLLTRINKDYPPGNEYGDDYRYLIAGVTGHPGLKRAMAATKARRS